MGRGLLGSCERLTETRGPDVFHGTAPASVLGLARAACRAFDAQSDHSPCVAMWLPQDRREGTCPCTRGPPGIGPHTECLGDWSYFRLVARSHSCQPPVLQPFWEGLTCPKDTSLLAARTLPSSVIRCGPKTVRQRRLRHATRLPSAGVERWPLWVNRTVLPELLLRVGVERTGP